MVYKQKKHMHLYFGYIEKDVDNDKIKMIKKINSKKVWNIKAIKNMKLKGGKNEKTVLQDDFFNNDFDYAYSMRQSRFC